MTLFDLLFLVSGVGCAVAVICIIGALAVREWVMARAILLGLGCYLLLYALGVVAVSAFTPQRVIPTGQTQCFDDWCIAVANGAQSPTLHVGAQTVTAQGRFLVVTLQVTSTAKRVSQREQIAQVYLVDGAGRRYDTSAVGQSALDAAGLSGPALDSSIGPGDAFTHTVVFDIPAEATGLSIVVAHSAFPGVVVIGDDQSFLHHPTLMQVDFAP
ncbi:MAG: DUF4352 domain-containing protein [Ktedonobacterales bacterium]|jgi:hypothetical protein